MGNYSILRGDEAQDWMSDYPGYGQMLSYTQGLGAEQVALTLRRLPPATGGKGSYGHRHSEQEELILVVDGVLQVKVDDDEFECDAGTAIRFAPNAARSVHNDGPGETTIVLVSKRLDDPQGDTEQIADFWPPDDTGE